MTPDRPITDPAAVAELAAALAAAGAFTIDLEFVSESRYVPELCLVQVGWGDPADPQVAAVDPLAVDPEPVVSLVGDPDVETVFHAAQADLALLGHRFGIEARAVYDSQIAAAFLGLGDQIGYANLVESLLGVSIDKGAQFTDWCERPLTEEQLRYAFDDVRHLLALWPELRRRLEESGRLGWVVEETESLARDAGTRTPPEEMFRRVKGWAKLRGGALGSLRTLAAWRERAALDGNRPPSWLVQDRSLIEIARRNPKDLDALHRIRGVKEGTVRRHGREILDAVRRGRSDPPPAEPRGRPLPDAARAWSVLLSGLVTARTREAGIAKRFVATRDDIDKLVRWWVEGDRASEPDLPLLSGWRRELAGAALLRWLEGETAIAIDESSEAGIRLAD